MDKPVITEYKFRKPATKEESRLAVYRKTDQLEALIKMENADVRTRELMEYIDGKRDKLTWLTQDLQEFVQNARDSLKRSDYIKKGTEVASVVAAVLGIAGLIFSLPAVLTMGAVLALITLVVCVCKDLTVSNEAKELRRLTDKLSLLHKGRIPVENEKENLRMTNTGRVPDSLNDSSATATFATFGRRDERNKNESELQ